MDFYLDEKSRAALARGKEQLARERVALAGSESSEKHAAPDTTLSATSAGKDIVAPILPQVQTAETGSTLVEGETHIATEQASSETESDDFQKFEIQAKQSHLSGNIFDSAQEDFSLCPFDFEAYLDDCLNLDSHSFSLFANNTDVTFSSLLAATPEGKQASPGEEKSEAGSEGKKTRLEKLPIKPGVSSKGGRKK